MPIYRAARVIPAALSGLRDRLGQPLLCAVE
jgi:hypothetical protein